MEGEPGELSSSSDENALTFAEYADEICPAYMAMGMEYDEFWHGNYAKLEYYRKAHEAAQEHANYAAWLQGGYVHDAVSIALGNAFRKKGTRPEPYLEKPYKAREKSGNAEQRKEKQEAAAEAARQKVIADFSAWGDNWKRVYGGEKK